MHAAKCNAASMLTKQRKLKSIKKNKKLYSTKIEYKQT